jgi:primosomal protein N''
MCECYQIGGPWIAEDPDCPEHGSRAQKRAKEKEDWESRVERLEDKIRDQQVTISRLTDRVEVFERLVNALKTEVDRTKSRGGRIR